MAITVERSGHLLLMGLDRADKRNSFTTTMIGELAAAYGELERDPQLRAGVLFAHGDHFTAGLDLAEVAPKLGEGGLSYPSGSLDPWGLQGPDRTKPVVAAAQGWCLTLGIELLLAADIRVAAADTRFAQIEIQRGIYPFGGATIRFPRTAGWGNAMRWLLTGDEFDAAEAHRIGLVQEVVPLGEQVERAVELAGRIAEQAPLGVRATVVSARRAVLEGERAAADKLVEELLPLFGTEDGQEGVRSFLERRKAVFQGR
ncbi:crotonase/enoyl-CoA hydratase family protein [Kutzneria viridogrisea]|uniref:Enoyl-CoA hydratase/isomerase n=2 Tax=Kutzneria TaxID=43356 RepID=W5W328_9PSEU|nr:crotonase/enoyl-CoA hydratase family protein [Kutzneria albida]AHH95608.1 enoyl-CoA hydratase/isomerase [Kutzneria albida DSM 43870]MBA8927029.1 enoyl-CoA hydratase/carnithine racemase [Kutzneria viridogrisea]